jgi:serine protease Do
MTLPRANGPDLFPATPIPKVGATSSVRADSTNCHVVPGRSIVSIFESKSKTPLRAVVVYADQRTDRCILKTDGKLNPIAAVRAAKELSIGARVYTIGNPSGLSNTLGEGLISGLRERRGIRVVQTTAQISPGSSGGALVDSTGALGGITTYFLKDAQSLNFAIAAEEYWR